MLDINSFKKLIGKKVNRFFIVIWPPFCEESMSDVDISVGIELVGQEGDILQLSISKKDNWTPVVSFIKEENVFEWSLFNTRLEKWMGGVIDNSMEYELYDATKDPLFENIVQLEILDIEFLTLSDKFNPFGVKIIFDNDYIVLSPCSDGSTVETSVFNRLDNLSNFNSMGNVESIRMKIAEIK